MEIRLINLLRNSFGIFPTAVERVDVDLLTLSDMCSHPSMLSYCFVDFKTAAKFHQNQKGVVAAYESWADR